MDFEFLTLYRDPSNLNTNLSYFQRTLDEDAIFHIPVVEAYPELQKSYLQQIAQPMDFRTIEEERLWFYKSIAELQLDLILVFSNCMEYNDTDSPLYHTAK